MAIRPNKSYTFHLNNFKNTRRTFVRTGVYSDGNCFYHSLLRAVNSEYRKKITYEEHLELVSKFKRDLCDWITIDIYKSLGNGEHYRLGFMNELSVLIHNQDQWIDYDKTITDQIIDKILTSDVIDNKILPMITTMDETNKTIYERFFVESRKYIVYFLSDKVNNMKIKQIVDRLVPHFVPMFKKAHDKTLGNFKRRIEKDGEFVDSILMECISKFCNHNFLFLTEDMSMYNNCSNVCSFESEKNCIIFLWIDENHFEILGELRENNFVYRVFQSDDELIRHIKDHCNLV